MDKLEEPTMGGTIKEMIDKINEIVEWCNKKDEPLKRINDSKGSEGIDL